MHLPLPDGGRCRQVSGYLDLNLNAKQRRRHLIFSPPAPSFRALPVCAVTFDMQAQKKSRVESWAAPQRLLLPAAHTIPRALRLLSEHRTSKRPWRRTRERPPCSHCFAHATDLLLSLSSPSVRQSARSLLAILHRFVRGEGETCGDWRRGIPL